MRKINYYIKLFFALFAYFAAKEVFKVFSAPLRLMINSILRPLNLWDNTPAIGHT
jgi:hypothetical protein